MQRTRYSSIHVESAYFSKLLKNFIDQKISIMESVNHSMFWLFLLGDERLVCGLDPVLNLLRPFPTFKYNYSMSAH